MSETLNRKKIIIYIVIGVLLIIGSLTAIIIYKEFSKPIVNLNDKESVTIFIPTGSSFEDVKNILNNQKVILDDDVFELLAKRKNYIENVKPGKYRIKNHLTANQLINKLRSGDQEVVRFTFNNIRFVDKLAGLAAKKLELDSADLSKLFHDNAYLKQFGFNEQTIVAMFLPNTYEFYWNTSADKFMHRMFKEYNKFWTKARKAKAVEIGLNPLDVSILASIVQEETNHQDEMADIAGVYINRLKRGMLLQADPTARFAYGDFSIKRVNYDYLKIDSPYNTYIYQGLPPGPICMPNPATIDKVLNYTKSDYIFFCAKPDNSGYHVFAKTNAAHERNARAYHRYLNQNRIR